MGICSIDIKFKSKIYKNIDYIFNEKLDTMVYYVAKIEF